MIEFLQNILINNKIILIIVFLAIIIDFVTGITKAVYNKNIQSKKLRKTIPKIIGYVTIIMMSLCIQIVFNIDFFPKIICLFIIVIEFLSTIENINEFVKIPDFLIKFLETKRDELNDGGMSDDK